MTFAGRFLAAEWRRPQRLLLPLFIDYAAPTPTPSIERLPGSTTHGGRAPRLLELDDALDRLTARPSVARPWIRSSYRSIAAGIAGLVWAALTVGSVVGGAGTGATTLFLLLTAVFCSLAVVIHKTSSQQASRFKRLSAEVQQLLIGADEGTAEQHAPMYPVDPRER